MIWMEAVTCSVSCYADLIARESCASALLQSAEGGFGLLRLPLPGAAASVRCHAESAFQVLPLSQATSLPLAGFYRCTSPCGAVLCVTQQDAVKNPGCKRSTIFTLLVKTEKKVW